MIKVISLILCFFIMGCGTTGQVFKYEDGIKEQVIEIHLDKEGALRYKDKDIECEFDSRKPTLWERFIQPIIGKASEQAQTTTQVNK